MGKIFSRVSALMFVLAALILIIVPKVTHADTPSGNIKFGDHLYAPLPPATANGEVFVTRSSFQLSVPITPVNEISKVTMEVEGVNTEMTFMDMPLCGNVCLGFLANVQFDSDSPIGVKKIVVTATDFNGHSLTHTYKVTLEDPNFTASLIPFNSENVKSDQPFDLVYKLDNVVQAIYGQDISISFDSKLIDFISAESLSDNLKILATKTDQYSIHIIASSNLQKADVNKDLIKLHFKAKPFDHQIITKVDIQKVIIADDKGNEASITTQGIEIVLGSADKTLLNSTIAVAQLVHDASIEGTTAGSYPVGSKATFKAVIDKSQIISTNDNATQELVDLAKTQLENAITTFKNNVVVINPNPNPNPDPNPIPSTVTGDLNNDSKVSVGDIGVMSSQTGKSASDSNWNLVKAADLNNDGKIDLDDLIVLAKLILVIL